MVVALLAAGCAPALREPPSVSVLAQKPAPPMPAGASSILEVADARWARRPDAPSVREAEALYLQAADADATDVRGLIGATRAKAWLVDHEDDARVREADARSAVQVAQWCGRRRPDEPACDYWLAIAVGVQARELRQTAEDGLKTMVAALTRAIGKDPAYDHAGPHRVLALVLVRAPGWPLGPGDPETGLEHAQRAVALSPDHAPNVLALAEALSDTKDRAGSRTAYLKARRLAAAARDAGDPDAAEWIAEADRALARLAPE